jgi:hypothetical protein
MGSYEAEVLEAAEAAEAAAEAQVAEEAWNSNPDPDPNLKP